jgi:hypothetical protein
MLFAGTCKAWNRRVHTKSQQPDNTPGSGGVFKPAESEEEWLQLDEKVNEYPTSRTFKAIGSGGQVCLSSTHTTICEQMQGLLRFCSDCAGNIPE